MKTTKTLIFLIFSFLGLTASAKSSIDTLQFEVKGNCGMCKERIEEALDVKGIKSAEWNEETQMLTVVYDASKITEIKIHELVAEAGHDTPLKKAKKEVYDNLPGCCHYEREE
ncbi:MAG: heavy-metal-associated domain-containing protein [Bacteroidota bacterium]|nr:heavy-metal-associated domain-containing protein [Bacteroidota bacterium]MDX5431771.1 heavy-metal-associated domain-containing protein [Bacteroidota bacterium]MDX5470484.1 heavy-metal-associated domain-containing protein [Bacteroidota bacterium]